MELSAGVLAEVLARPGAGLLLDLDGTLVDSEPVHREAYRRYFAARGWDVADVVVRQFSGRRAHEVFPVVRGPWDGEDPHALTRDVLDVLARLDERPVPVPGAADLLAACARTGMPVCVVTSARLPWVALALDALGTAAGGTGGAGLASVTAEDCVHGKPDPEPFVRGAERLGLPVSGLVAVEDAPAGIASARAAKIGLVVGVSTSQTARELLAAGADAVVDDLTLLADAVAAGVHRA